MGESKKKDKRKERGWEIGGWVGERRCWRNEEEIWNKGKQGGRKRKGSPHWLYLLSLTSEGFKTRQPEVRNREFWSLNNVLQVIVSALITAVIRSTNLHYTDKKTVGE